MSASPSWAASVLQSPTQMAWSSLSVYKNVSLTATPVQVSGSPVNLCGFYIYNNATAGNERSIKFFDQVAAPTVGVTPPIMTITVGGRSGLPCPFPGIIPFKNALWILATTASGDSATVAPAAGEVSITLLTR